MDTEIEKELIYDIIGDYSDKLSDLIREYEEKAIDARRTLGMPTFPGCVNLGEQIVRALQAVGEIDLHEKTKEWRKR